MPSPLLNLAAESGYCEFVTVLIDEGKVEVDTLGMQEIFFCFFLPTISFRCPWRRWTGNWGRKSICWGFVALFP
jgi:hypothetical protein